MTAVRMDTAPIRVLIVDDTPDIRMLLRFTLERDPGFTVVAEAGNGRDAQLRAQEELPDVVLLDLAMPVMDGLAALPGLRQILPNAAIIVLSGFDADRMTQRALDAGADGYLQKGASPSRIIEYLRSVSPERPAEASFPRDPRPHVVPVETVAPGTLEAIEAGLRLAPYGVVMLRAGQDETVIEALNDAAARMLHISGQVRNRPLVEVSEGLALVLDQHAAAVSANRPVETELHSATGTMEVTFRSMGELIACYLTERPAGDEGARMRQALATVAHEIRNPVIVLQGVAEALASDGIDDSPEQRMHMVGAIARQALVLDRVTSDLLGAAQAKRGKLEVDVQPVRLDSVINASIHGVPGLGDVAVVGAAGAVVMGDAVRLQQVLANLLSNAMKYGRPQIRIRVEERSEHVRISVEDEGPGVPLEFQPLLFTEFARAADHQYSSGTGLGLYVVRSLIEAQGGVVNYEGQPGAGAVFTLTLRRGDLHAG